MVVPTLVLGYIAVALTEPQLEMSGFHGATAWLLSLVSVAVTLGAAAAWGYVKLVRKRR